MLPSQNLIAQNMQKDIQSFDLAVLAQILLITVRIYTVLENEVSGSAGLQRMTSLRNEH